MIGVLFFALVDSSGNLALSLGSVPFTWLLTIPLTGGYLIAYATKIIERSAVGDEQLPDWPDFSGWIDDVVFPFLKVITALTLCLTPAILCRWLLESDWPCLVLAVFGLLCLPMGILVLTMYRTFTAMNPMFLLPSIWRVLPEYAVATVLWLSIFAFQIFCEIKVRHIPGWGSLLTSFLSVYCLTVEMRILGLLFWTCRERLGWFRDG